jgi:hypothetical protein
MKYPFLFLVFVFFMTDVNAQNCFSIGSSKSDVKSVQGTPTSLMKLMDSEIWSYDYSTVTFDLGIVAGYSNTSKNLKICSTSKGYSNSKCFSIGSTKDAIRSIQGTPTSIIKLMDSEIWSYEYSSVTFDAGVVSGYSNISKNLKICSEENRTYNTEPDKIDRKISSESSQNSVDEQDVGFDPFIGQISSNVIFRTDPSQSSTKIKTLNSGSQVYVYSRNAINGYYKVIDIMTSSVGWVHSDYVNHIQDVDVNQGGAFQSTGYTSSFNSEVKIRNKSSYSIKLVVGDETFTVSPNSSKTVNIKPGRSYYIASAPGVIPASGYQSFESNNGYEWEFWVSTTKY